MNNKTFIIHWHTYPAGQRFHQSYGALSSGLSAVTAENKNAARRALRNGLVLCPGEALKIDRVEVR